MEASTAPLSSSFTGHFPPHKTDGVASQLVGLPSCKSGRPLPRNLADSCELTETTEPRQPSISRGRAVRANDPDPLHGRHQPLPLCHHLLVMSCPLRCRANLTQIRQSRLDAGLGLRLLLGKVVLKLVFLFSLGGVLTPSACVSHSAPLSPVPRLLSLP